MPYIYVYTYIPYVVDSNVLRKVLVVVGYVTSKMSHEQLWSLQGVLCCVHVSVLCVCVCVCTRAACAHACVCA